MFALFRVALSGLIDVLGEQQFSEIYQETDQSVKSFKQKRKRESLDDSLVIRNDNNYHVDQSQQKAKKGGVFANVCQNCQISQTHGLNVHPFYFFIFLF